MLLLQQTKATDERAGLNYADVETFVTERLAGAEARGGRR
jgi:hypothetical protein